MAGAATTFSNGHAGRAAPSESHPPSFWWRPYFVAIAVSLASVIGAHVIVWLAWEYVAAATFAVFFAAVVIAALYGGRGAGLITTILATLDLNYSFLPPFNSFSLEGSSLIDVLCFAAVTLITSSLQTRRMRAEEQLRNTLGQLELRVRERTAELEWAQRDLLEIGEREQHRIGYDLHDGLGQELMGIALLSTAMAERSTRDPSRVKEDAEQVADLVHEAIRHTRDLARGLCAADLENEGLSVALRQLGEQLNRLPTVNCQVNAPLEIVVEAVAASHLYRIAQEAASNAVRHARAPRITIELNQNAELLALDVTDNGHGFSTTQRGNGMGLRLMRQRAKMIGGTLEIESAPGQGTAVHCRVRREGQD